MLGQMKRQLENSRCFRQGMEKDLEECAEARWLAKPVLDSRALPLDSDNVRLQGPGVMSFEKKHTISGKGSIRLDVPTDGCRRHPSNRAFSVRCACFLAKIWRGLTVFHFGSMSIHRRLRITSWSFLYIIRESISCRSRVGLKARIHWESHTESGSMSFGSSLMSIAILSQVFLCRFMHTALRCLRRRA